MYNVIYFDMLIFFIRLINEDLFIIYYTLIIDGGFYL